MGKVSINELTLTNIGAAIREKTGKADLIAPGDMPAEIRSIVSGGGGGSEDCNGLHVPESALVLTGDCNYRFANGGWDWFIRDFGDRITTKDLAGTSYILQQSNIEEFPAELNYINSSTGHALGQTFMYAKKLRKVPKMNNVRPSSFESLFNSCNALEELPENFADNWDWNFYTSNTSEYAGNVSRLFYQCYKIRSIPKAFLKQENIIKPMAYSYSLYYYMFDNDHSLEEVELPVYNQSTWTNNGFNSTFSECYRLKKLTFKLQEDGTPYSVNWKTQTLDLFNKIGNCAGASGPFKNKTNFTDATKIDTEEKWRGYIDGTYPDGWAMDESYSTFGKTAATNLINTIPDTSAYLASSGGTNTIKFKTNAASAIPGENISELPEEVIAVAAAKGWTVTFA